MARLFAVISQAAGCIWGFQVRLAGHLDEFLAEMPNTRISAGGRGISSGVRARFKFF